MVEAGFSSPSAIGIETIGMTKEIFESRGHTRLKQIQYLIGTKQIDSDFFWTT